MNPISTDNPYQERIAAMLRELLAAAGLTFQGLAQQTDGISRVTLQRAASGNRIPQEKTLRAFAEGCGFPEAVEPLLRLRVQARVEARGVLRTIGTAPHLSLISDWRDLSRALEYLYEAAGAPSLREVRERSGNVHALSTSTLRRIILRVSRPVDEQQLLALVHGCGDNQRDDLWRAAWAKVTGITNGGDELATAAPISVPAAPQHQPTPPRAKVMAQSFSVVVEALQRVKSEMPWASFDGYHQLAREGRGIPRHGATHLLRESLGRGSDVPRALRSENGGGVTRT